MTPHQNLTVLFISALLSVHPLLGADAQLSVQGLPAPLSVLNSPVAAQVDANGALYLQAAGRTNLFTNPSGGAPVSNASMALMPCPDEFVFTARVTGQLRDVYDVAALAVYQDSRTWAKLCFENSVARVPTIVSVVNRDVSDDCNSQSISGDTAYLAIMRRGSAFSFHYSPDGKSWTLVRHFALNVTGPLQIGFVVHASQGNGFAATFSEISFTTKTPRNLRQFPAAMP